MEQRLKIFFWIDPRQKQQFERCFTMFRSKLSLSRRMTGIDSKGNHDASALEAQRFGFIQLGSTREVHCARGFDQSSFNQGKRYSLEKRTPVGHAVGG